MFVYYKMLGSVSVCVSILCACYNACVCQCVKKERGERVKRKEGREHRKEQREGKKRERE